jgi:hypothetical protein
MGTLVAPLAGSERNGFFFIDYPPLRFTRWSKFRTSQTRTWLTGNSFPFTPPILSEQAETSSRVRLLFFEVRIVWRVIADGQNDSIPYAYKTLACVKVF